MSKFGLLAAPIMAMPRIERAATSDGDERLKPTSLRSLIVSFAFAGKLAPTAGRDRNGAPLGDFEHLVTATLAASGGPAYALDIAERLASQIGSGFALPQVHITLRRLERKGFISSSVEDHPRPIRGGRARRVFKMEDKGARALDESTAYRKALVTSDPRSNRSTRDAADQEKIADGDRNYGGVHTADATA